MVSQSRSTALSVVIPAFNAIRYIEECLRSVLAQTDCPLFEVIVVDDGSTDGTSEVVRANFPEVRLFCKENGGPGSARNLGVKNALGDVIIFVDADDVMLPGRLADQGGWMTDNTSVGLTFGNQLFQSRPKFDHNYEVGLVKTEEFIEVPGMYQRLVMYGNQIANTACAVRRDVYLAVGGQREDIFVGEDYAMNCAVARRWPIAATRRYMTWYREGHISHLMASSHTYLGPVLVLMDELLSYGHSLDRRQYTVAHRRWQRLANMLLRRTWVDLGKIATLSEIRRLQPLLPSCLALKWRLIVTVLPSGVGRFARRLKRSVMDSVPRGSTAG